MIANGASRTSPTPSSESSTGSASSNSMIAESPRRTCTRARSIHSPSARCSPASANVSGSPTGAATLGIGAFSAGWASGPTTRAYAHPITPSATMQARLVRKRVNRGEG